MRRSTVLSLHPQLVFPGLAHKYQTWQNFFKRKTVQLTGDAENKFCRIGGGGREGGSPKPAESHQFGAATFGIMTLGIMTIGKMRPGFRF